MLKYDDAGMYIKGMKNENEHIERGKIVRLDAVAVTLLFVAWDSFFSIMRKLLADCFKLCSFLRFFDLQVFFLWMKNFFQTCAITEARIVRF